MNRYFVPIPWSGIGGTLDSLADRGPRAAHAEGLRERLAGLITDLGDADWRTRVRQHVNSGNSAP